jgi:hypothetical protein
MEITIKNKVPSRTFSVGTSFSTINATDSQKVWFPGE